MSPVVGVLLATIWLTAQTAPTAAQETWLRSFEGTWSVDGAVGEEAKVILSINREGTNLVLRVVVRDREIVTRYDLSGADVINEQMGSKSLFRSRIADRSVVTQIWDSATAAGPPSRVETRYLQSPDLLVTELATPGGQSFRRTVLRRRPK